MKVPLNWLREYCSPDLDTAQIEERLTMTGTKVETILHHGVPSIEGFVVGKVLAVSAHPDADRLRVCEVDIGEDEPAGIVCGAPNVEAGQTVAVALPGARMPDGTMIKAAKLRGVPSAGMILAADELQIDSDHSGIMVLNKILPEVQLAAGTPLEDVLAISTDVIELEITPNRPDCLGVYGVARELHAATGAPLAIEPWADEPSIGEQGGMPHAGGMVGGEGVGISIEGDSRADLTVSPARARESPQNEQPQPPPVTVKVECPDLCKRFTARVFEDLTIAPSPPWLKSRLSAAGQRPINNVVDITNYAMLLTGQPLHAFDLDRVAGQTLTVRRAREGEQVNTLDGQTRTLDSEMVVIEDADGPTSIAGIMGGERSEVQGDTKRVLMEVANWNGPNIHRTSWALGLRSEASGRFEKGLAPEQCMHAQAVATQLMVELCGATVLPETIDLAWEPQPAQTIRLREQRVEAILGMPVPHARQAEILRALDFDVAELAEPALDVTVPAVRREDVTREADLIEEVARIHGLEALPTTLPARRGAYGRLSESQHLRRRAVDTLVGRGLHEVVGWTFTPPTLYDRLRLPEGDKRRRAPVLENPLSEDQSRLRTTLLGSLLDVAAHNSARGMADVGIFEVGRCFVLDGESGVTEHRSLAVLMSGRVAPATWGAPDPSTADVFAVKAMLEALGSALRVEIECRVGEQPFLHPGRAAAIFCEGEEIGWLGELHPLVARGWGIEAAAAMEFSLDRLVSHATGQILYRDVVSYPGLSQDLAVVLPADVPAARAMELVRAAGGDLLDGVEVFDVYTGTQVGEGKRSLALSLSFRAPDRTLTDADVVPLRERIVQALEELGGELRA
ncbi:MAG TPA: phenylalanine--tRNA ligase subunit beta [Solirubrobacteraceae bacterium]